MDKFVCTLGLVAMFIYHLVCSVAQVDMTAVVKICGSRYVTQYEMS